MGTRKSRHNKGRKPLYKEHRRGGADGDALNARFMEEKPTTVRKQAVGEAADRLNRNKIPYHRVATGRVINAGFNYLTDLIVRPGIQKRFWPILMYRGAMSPGHAHRFWNMSLLMMASEAETLADGLKIINNPTFSQICGPVRKPNKFTLRTFFGRLWDNPDTTDLIPGFTDYVRSLELGPSTLTPVELETMAKTCAPWRVSLHPEPAKPEDFKKERGAPPLFYPYAAHDSTRPDEGRDLVMFVNSLIPKTIPDQWRADICQDMILSILSGNIDRESADYHVKSYISKGFSESGHLFEGGKPKVYLDAPISAADGEVSLHDVLHDGSYQHWSDAQDDPDDVAAYDAAWEEADRSIAMKDYFWEQKAERERFADTFRTHQRATQVDDIFEKQVKAKQAELQARGLTLLREDVIAYLDAET